MFSRNDMKKFIFLVILFPLITFASSMWAVCSDELENACLQPFDVSEEDITKEQAIEIAIQAFVLTEGDLNNYLVESAQYNDVCFTLSEAKYSIESDEKLSFKAVPCSNERWIVRLKSIDSTCGVLYSIDVSTKGRVLEIRPQMNIK